MGYAKVKVGQLKKLRDKASDFDKVMEDVFREYLARLSLATIGYAKHNTNVVTGLLRNSYFATNVTKNDIVYSVTIYNPTEYASFYEYGHRNPKGWTQGRFPLKRGIMHAEVASERTLNRIIEKKLKELANGE